MEIALLFLICLSVLLAALSLYGIKRIKPNGNSDTTVALEKKLQDIAAINRDETRQMHGENRQEMNARLDALKDAFTAKIAETTNQLENSAKNDAKANRSELAAGFTTFREELRNSFSDMNKKQIAFNQQSEERIKDIRETVEKQLAAIKQDNATQLSDMRKTVDEKLQSTLEKRLGESFKQVSDRLEQVHKGLGEMQTLATGVGDLKKVLANVKTRGTLGEYQLANILEQILSPQQYEKNAATKPGSQARVEFAIKLPGNDKTVLLPIDSKFPLNYYEQLLNAYDAGDTDAIKLARSELLKAVDKFAKDINQKYLSPPHTTEFGVMFLPVEGLFAEVLQNPEMFSTLQNKYKITLTGPTTLAAFLNSLSMGFRTLAVQKRSSEVWDILTAVKAEFGKFTDTFDTAIKQINTASNTLENLRSTRTNQMQRKLDKIETADQGKLEMDTPPPKAD